MLISPWERMHLVSMIKKEEKQKRPEHTLTENAFHAMEVILAL